MCDCVCRYISEYAKWEISDGFNDKTDNFLYTRPAAQSDLMFAGTHKPLRTEMTLIFIF